MADEATARPPQNPSSGPRPGGSYQGRPQSGRPGGRPPGPPMGPGGRRRPMMRRRVCRICLDRRGFVDWKAVNTLRSFVTDRGKIMSARQTGTCSSCQRKLTRAIKRARNMALIPLSAAY